MTINEFNKQISEMAMTHMGLERYCSYLRYDTREDKYLREKYLTIQGVLRHKSYSGENTIELGDERGTWDAGLAGTDLFKVVHRFRPISTSFVSPSLVARWGALYPSTPPSRTNQRNC